MKNNPVLQPYKENVNLRNRVVMAPMTRSRADNSELKPTNDLHGLYYEQRASAGLIISEGTQVSKEGIGYINTPGIYSEAQVNGWKKVTKRVHDEGGKIFAQLWHVGRISHPDFHDGELPLAPSAINPEEESFTPDGMKNTVTPKAMSQADIERTIKDFKQAAIHAKEAGFDGIEIHASNGYLIHQFFTNCSNVRTDKYGGSIENKSRFFFEVLEAIKTVIPVEKIGVRFNPSLNGLFGITMDEDTIPTFEYIINKLNNYNLAYIHLSQPFTDVSDISYAIQDIAKHFRPIYKGTLMINGGYTQEKANKVIASGHADLVSFAKLYISNPDLVERFQNNEDLAEWDEDTFYTPGPEGYTDYPKIKETKNA